MQLCLHEGEWGLLLICCDASDIYSGWPWKCKVAAANMTDKIVQGGAAQGGASTELLSACISCAAALWPSELSPEMVVMVPVVCGEHLADA